MTPTSRTHTYPTRWVSGFWLFLPPFPPTRRTGPTAELSPHPGHTRGPVTHLYPIPASAAASRRRCRPRRSSCRYDLCPTKSLCAPNVDFRRLEKKRFYPGYLSRTAIRNRLLAPGIARQPHTSHSRCQETVLIRRFSRASLPKILKGPRLKGVGPSDRHLTS